MTRDAHCEPIGAAYGQVYALFVPSTISCQVATDNLSPLAKELPALVVTRDKIVFLCTFSRFPSKCRNATDSSSCETARIRSFWAGSAVPLRAIDTYCVQRGVIWRASFAGFKHQLQPPGLVDIDGPNHLAFLGDQWRGKPGAASLPARLPLSVRRRRRWIQRGGGGSEATRSDSPAALQSAAASGWGKAAAVSTIGDGRRLPKSAQQIAAACQKVQR